MKRKLAMTCFYPTELKAQGTQPLPDGILTNFHFNKYVDNILTSKWSNELLNSFPNNDCQIQKRSPRRYMYTCLKSVRFNGLFLVPFAARHYGADSRYENAVGFPIG